MSGPIAVINAGSTSIKFALYESEGRMALQFRGQVEQIGVSPRLLVVDSGGARLVNRNWPKEGFDHRAATQEILKSAWVVPTDEERMVARHAPQLLGLGRPAGVLP